MKDIIGVMIIILILLGFTMFLLITFKYFLDRSKEINVVEVYEQQASIEYCDRHNICDVVLVDRFELVYIQRFNNFTYYIRFEVDGELRLHSVDRTTVTKK